VQALPSGRCGVPHTCGRSERAARGSLGVSCQPKTSGKRTRQTIAPAKKSYRPFGSPGWQNGTERNFLPIPPAQHKSLSASAEGSIVDLYRDRVERLVCGFPLSDNYFAWQAFGQRYDTEQRAALPRYLRGEHFTQLRYHSGRVETRVAALTEALRDQPDSSFDSFVLLDTMDWMETKAIAALWTELARVGEPGARIIFRTAGPSSVVEPALPDDLRARFSYERARSEELHARDRSAVYGMFHLYVLTG